MDELRNRYSRDETVQDLMRRNRALEEELMGLRDSLGIRPGRPMPTARKLLVASAMFYSAESQLLTGNSNRLRRPHVSFGIRNVQPSIFVRTEFRRVRCSARFRDAIHSSPRPAGILGFDSSVPCAVCCFQPRLIPGRRRRLHGRLYPDQRSVFHDRSRSRTPVTIWP